MSTEVIFFPGGVTACLQDGEQVSELQSPWLLLYVELLETVGIDPCTVDFTMPDGRHAEIFVTKSGKYNWRLRS